MRVCVCVCVHSTHTNSFVMHLSLDVTLSSDFISGFCGETEADHEETLSLMELVRFDTAYLFAYSMRKVRSPSSPPLILSSNPTHLLSQYPYPTPPTLLIHRRHMRTIITKTMSLNRSSSGD